MRLMVLAIVAWSTVASAHGASGSHDSPQWCGQHLAVLADGGVMLDGKLVAITDARGLLGWSPACDRIVLAGPRVWMIDVATRGVRDLGALPGGFQDVMRMDGPAPSVRFAPSGKRFAVVVVNRTIFDERIARFDVASGTGITLPVHGEIKAFGLVDDDTAVVAWRTPGSDEVQLSRVDDQRATRITATHYKDARTSVAPFAIALMTSSGGLVVVDPSTGKERSLLANVDYVQAMSADGSRVLAVVNGRASAVELDGTVTAFDGELATGLSADERSGWSRDGRTVYARAAKGWRTSVLGTKARTWTPPAGEIQHVSLSPDGKRLAWISEVPETGTSPTHCAYEAWTRADLYVGVVGARPTKVATLAHLHSCSVE